MERDTEEERKKTSERFEKMKEMIQQRDSVTANLKEHSEQVFLFYFKNNTMILAS